MDGKFLQDCGGGGYGVGSAEKRTAGSFSGREKSPGNGLVSCDVPVSAFAGGLYRFDSVSVRYCLDICRIIVPVIEDFLVRSNHLRMFLGEFLLKILVDCFKRAVEDVAGYSKREHILALENRLQIHSAVLETFLCHCGDRGGDDCPVLNSQFHKRIVRNKSGLLHSGLVKRVGIHQDHSVTLAPLGVCLEGGRVHRYKKIAVISGGVDVGTSNVYLIAGYTGNRSVGRPDLSREIRESRQGVAINGGHICKKGPRELHTIPGVPCKSNHNIFSINYFVLHRLYFG